ncbi:MAG: FIST N-terminal domain-containing protein [Candidatus Zapsychrus exili]|nr:FIST N-terminal domain-containing protein [Candidatus Zapsychrus exili]
MSINIGIGFSQDINIELAAAKAVSESITKLGKQRVDLCLVFSTIHYPPQKTIPIIKQAFKSKTNILGCSSAGIILSDSIETRGIAVLTMCSDQVKCGIGSTFNITSENVREAGIALAKSTLENFGQHGRQVSLFFIDGQIGNSSLLLKGLQEVMGNIFPIIGACSSDNFQFKNTFQIYDEKVTQHSATGLILGGQVSAGIAGRHGWRPLGKPRIVTESNGNIIKKIDNKKASLLYEEYFGKEAKNLGIEHLSKITILYPLGIFIGRNNEYLLRNPINILHDGSIICQGDVPVGSEVHVMIGNKDSCKKAAIEAAKEAKKNLLGKEAKLVIIIESMARLKLLGRMASSEIQGIRKIFGEKVNIIGMYSNGEIFPFQTDEKFKKPLLQNESIAIVAIS